MSYEMQTIDEIGTQIGMAIARDVIADGMDAQWTGLDAQDGDHIPPGMDRDAVEDVARVTYLAAIAKHQATADNSLARSPGWAPAFQTTGDKKMTDDKPVEIVCDRCNCRSTEFERLSGGHWYFWCCHCKDHIVIPTVQYLEMRIAK